MIHLSNVHAKYGIDLWNVKSNNNKSSNNNNNYNATTTIIKNNNNKNKIMQKNIHIHMSQTRVYGSYETNKIYVKNDWEL